MNKSPKVPSLGAIFGLSLMTSAHGAIVYQDNFDAGTSGTNWTSKLSAADASVSYAFDYSTLGIPSAPNSSGGSTVGMRFLVNQSAGVFQGISATPNSQSFTGDFVLTFDAWLNYVGPLGPGGNGSTQLASFGWGASGNDVVWAGSSTGALFAASLDGGSGTDYRLYKNNAVDANDATYAANGSGFQNNSNAYYTGLFPAVSAPTAQTTLFASQTGTTDVGEIAFVWRAFKIERSGDTISWFVDNNLMASTSLTGAATTGNNIVFGMFDSNAGSSTDPNDFLNAAIFDNIVVTVVPEPTGGTLALLGGLAALRRKRFSK